MSFKFHSGHLCSCKAFTDLQAWATCSPHAPGSQGSLKLGWHRCRAWLCWPLQRSVQHRECVLCPVVGHWIPLPCWDSKKYSALTDGLIIQNVHNRFSMGISSQPVKSAKDSEVLCPCLCSPGVVLNALLSLNQNRGLWHSFCCHEGCPDTLSSGLQTKWGEKWSSNNHWQLKDKSFKVKQKNMSK